MVVPSPQPIQPQTGQWQPNPLGQAPSPQPPPVPQSPYHPPQHMGQGGAKTVISISNLSLFAIVLSLIFLGAFTFLGGLLLGMWLEGIKTPSHGLVQQVNGQYYPSPLPPQGGSVSPSPQYSQGSQGGNVSQLMGTAAGESITGLSIPAAVPNFLAPFVSVAQQTAANQATTTVQHATQHAQEGAIPFSHHAGVQAPLSPDASGGQAPAPPHAQAPAPSHASPEAHASAPLQTKGQYTVHLGSFAAKENADTLQERLQALGYTTSVKEGKSLEGDVLYQVYSGQYPTYAMALKAATYFMSHNISGARVVKVSTMGGNAS